MKYDKLEDLYLKKKKTTLPYFSCPLNSCLNPLTSNASLSSIINLDYNHTVILPSAVSTSMSKPINSVVFLLLTHLDPLKQVDADLINEKAIFTPNQFIVFEYSSLIKPLFNIKKTNRTTHVRMSNMSCFS